MSPKLQKASFITILVLLAIFIPITGISLYFKFWYQKPVVQEPENIAHELHFNGKLWFYNEEDELIGTYTCEHTYCDIAKSSKTEKEYSLNSYPNLEETTLPILQNQYVFLKDNESEEDKDIFLYQIPNQFAYKNIKYLSVKDYGVGLTNHYYILENESHKFGVIDLSLSPLVAIPYDYDFLGVLNKMDENGLLIADYFVALKGKEWMIVAKNGGELTRNIEEEIVDFNGENIITKGLNDFYHIVDYNNRKIVDTDFQKLSFVDKYLECITTDEYYILNLSTQNPVSEIHSITPEDKIETIVKEKEIELKINEEVIETIPI